MQPQNVNKIEDGSMDAAYEVFMTQKDQCLNTSSYNEPQENQLKSPKVANRNTRITPENYSQLLDESSKKIPSNSQEDAEQGQKEARKGQKEAEEGQGKKMGKSQGKEEVKGKQEESKNKEETDLENSANKSNQDEKKKLNFWNEFQKLGEHLITTELTPGQKKVNRCCKFLVSLLICLLGFGAIKTFDSDDIRFEVDKFGNALCANVSGTNHCYTEIFDIVSQRDMTCFWNPGEENLKRGFLDFSYKLKNNETGYQLEYNGVVDLNHGKPPQISIYAKKSTRFLFSPFAAYEFWEFFNLEPAKYFVIVNLGKRLNLGWTPAKLLILSGIVLVTVFLKGEFDLSSFLIPFYLLESFIKMVGFEILFKTYKYYKPSKEEK